MYIHPPPHSYWELFHSLRSSSHHFVATLRLPLVTSPSVALASNQPSLLHEVIHWTLLACWSWPPFNLLCCMKLVADMDNYWTTTSHWTSPPHVRTTSHWTNPGYHHPCRWFSLVLPSVLVCHTNLVNAVWLFLVLPNYFNYFTSLPLSTSFWTPPLDAIAETLLSCSRTLFSYMSFRTTLQWMPTFWTGCLLLSLDRCLLSSHCAFLALVWWSAVCLPLSVFGTTMGFLFWKIAFCNFASCFGACCFVLDGASVLPASGLTGTYLFCMFAAGG